MAAESRKRIEIFKAGRHTDMSGTQIDFSAGDLIATAAAYDPALHEAPLVIGHPRTDDPAYGWVYRLLSPGESLFAELGRVDPAFVDMVRAARFKKISASFYMPGSPQNPVPGVYYLRHVGFLGAQPPAIKGLQPVAFAAFGEGTIEFSLPSLDAKALQEAWEEQIAAYVQTHGVSYRDALLAVAAEHPGHITDLDGIHRTAGEIQGLIDRDIAKYQKLHPEAGYGECLSAVSKNAPGLFNLQATGQAANVRIDEKREQAIASYMEANPAADYRTAFIEIGRRFPEYFKL